MLDTYKVYIQADASGNIIAVNSSAFLEDATGWTQIDEGSGDRFHHAQGNYLDKPLATDKGIFQYRYIDGEITEKTPEKIEAEEAALPPPPPTAEERLAAQEKTNTVLSTTLDILFTEILPALTGT